jgi:hypothetical protein
VGSALRRGEILFAENYPTFRLRRRRKIKGSFVSLQEPAATPGHGWAKSFTPKIPGFAALETNRRRKLGPTHDSDNHADTMHMPGPSLQQTPPAHCGPVFKKNGFVLMHIASRYIMVL